MSDVNSRRPQPVIELWTRRGRREAAANPVLTADRIDIGGRLTNSIIGEGNNGRENSVGGKINFTIKITADARGSCTR